MDILDMESKIELEALRHEIDKLKVEVKKYKKVIEGNELEDELDNFTSTVSIEEQICIDGIKHLSELFKNGVYDANDVKDFDILHKNIRLIRGQPVDTKKAKKFDVKEALRVVEGFKK